MIAGSPESSARGTAPRTRFAPSPTGTLHLGGARTALFCFLMAKKNQGQFIIRFEDTDRERSKESFIQEILESLTWLGLVPDEGTGASGPFAPYRQSERQPLYLDRIANLRQQQAIYPCFCSKERLEQLKKEQEKRKMPPRYDGLCAQLTSVEVEKKLAQKEPHTLRFRIPREDKLEVSFEDLIHGPLQFKTRDLEDFIVVREDGTPPFLLPSLIDDLEMQISVVLRGDDHLANTPKQILLAEALGKKPPQYGHLPLVLAEDGRPLSKRQGDLSIAALREQGFIPAAVTQALLLLGWSPPPEQDVNLAWSLQDQIQIFSLERVHHSPARLDLSRMRAINRAHLRKLDFKALQHQVREYFSRTKTLPLHQQVADLLAQKNSLVDRTLTLVQQESDLLADFALTLLRIVLGPNPAWTQTQSLEELRSEKIQGSLKVIYGLLEEENVQSLQDLTDALKNRHAIGGKDFFHPFRLAIMGETQGPKMADLFDLLGKEMLLKRLRQFVYEKQI